MNSILQFENTHAAIKFLHDNGYELMLDDGIRQVYRCYDNHKAILNERNLTIEMLIPQSPMMAEAC